MKITFGQPPEWFPPVKLKGLEHVFLREPIDGYRSQYIHMFLQDMQQLVPLGSRRERDAYFDIETNDQQLAIKTLAALDRKYRSTHMADALRHILSFTAMELFQAGRSVIALRTKLDEYEWNITSVHPSASRIVSLGPFLIQFLPERDNGYFGKDAETYSREIRILNRKSVLCIELPSTLKRFKEKFLKRLQLLSNLANPDTDKLFPPISLENPNPRKNILDFSAFRKNFDIALFQTIRETGWMARNFTGEEKSDFLTSVWRLRFRKFQATLRMEIIRQLNEQIPNIIRQSSPDFEMFIREKGLLTPDELTNMERQLYAGDISFEEVIDSTFSL
ncbi:hypothetical protein AB1K62_00640 [Parasphingorhabdus sp. JC815]|uniref:hypothetical protein n=1 Tax=Parasphingorhabdus sp. JC815 TaxID=3232140 RepID=UPI00345B405C